MAGSRIFDWGGPRIVKVWDDGQNVALFALKSWPIWGGGMALEQPLATCIISVTVKVVFQRTELEEPIS